MANPSFPKKEKALRTHPVHNAFVVSRFVF